MMPGVCTPGFLTRALPCRHGSLGQTRRDFSPNRAKSSLSGSESGSQSASTSISISDGPVRRAYLHSDIDSDTEGRPQLHPAEVEEIDPGREPQEGHGNRERSKLKGFRMVLGARGVLLVDIASV
jgi:hypothetical protein